MLSTNGVAPGAGVTGSSAGGTVTLVPPITSGGAGLGLEGIIAKVMGFIFWLGAVVCPILIVWGGFNIATAGDDQNKMSTGKQTITYAIVGLLIIAVSAALANAIKYILQ
ncbi:MAG: hypothetical protein MUD10_04200 [Candidatus Pacebacteria bacterium]|nr:hypothetical protein [Candidatus Paceibacterota bacterium]